MRAKQIESAAAPATRQGSMGASERTGAAFPRDGGAADGAGDADAAEVGAADDAGGAGAGDDGAGDDGAGDEDAGDEDAGEIAADAALGATSPATGGGNRLLCAAGSTGSMSSPSAGGGRNLRNICHSRRTATASP
jgi:streptogrisin D